MCFAFACVSEIAKMEAPFGSVWESDAASSRNQLDFSVLSFQYLHFFHVLSIACTFQYTVYSPFTFVFVFFLSDGRRIFRQPHRRGARCKTVAKIIKIWPSLAWIKKMHIAIKKSSLFGLHQNGCQNHKHLLHSKQRRKVGRGWRGRGWGAAVAKVSLQFCA